MDPRLRRRHLRRLFGMTLVDLILHYENAILRIREKEANDDCVDSQSLPVAVTRYKRLEVSASHAFTATNFYIVQQELRNMGDRKSTRLNSSHSGESRMPSSA